jgi:hypothetical protein
MSENPAQQNSAPELPASPVTESLQEELSATPPEEKPMLEVHAAHHTPMTWKEVLLHIGIISTGLLIALGLEQTAEFFHHRHMVAETRRSLAAEREVNKLYFSVQTEELNRILPLLHTNLAVYQFLRQHPSAPKSQWPGEIHWYGIYPRYVDAVWKTAQANNVLHFMPQAEVRSLSGLYDRLDLLTEANQAAKQTKRALFINSIEQPDPAKLTPAQLDEQIRLSAQLIRDYSNAANEQANIHRLNSDFAPAPDMDEVYAMSNITIQAEEKRIVNDEIKRMRVLDYLEESEDANIKATTAK